MIDKYLIFYYAQLELIKNDIDLTYSEGKCHLVCFNSVIVKSLMRKQIIRRSYDNFND